MEAESAWAVVVALVLAWVREQGLPAVGTMVVIQVAWKGYLIGYLNIAEFISFL